MIVVVLSLLMVAVGAGLAYAAFWFNRLDNERIDTTWRFGVALGAGIAAILLVAGSVIFPVTIVSSKIICRNKAANLELPYRWSMSAGCYVKFHGQWIGIDKALGIVTK